MKRFIISVLCVSLFFIGLGGLFEKATATLKSDEKALEIIKRARIAIGGDSAIANVRSMTITAKATKTLEVEGVARTENGDVEINFELPNKMSRKMKFGAGGGDVLIEKQFDVLITKKENGDNIEFKSEPADGKRKVVIKKPDGTTEEIKPGEKEPVMIRKMKTDAVTTEDGENAAVDGKKVFIRRAAEFNSADRVRSNELFRTTLSLLLTAPEGLNVSYTYVGESSVDGAACDIVAANDGGSTFKLYLDKQSGLPRMISFQSHKPFMIKIDKSDALPNGEGDKKIFTRKLPEPEMAEFQIKFSDFRSVNGLQLPHRWTQTIAGKDDEVLDITSYEINPPNIAEKFKEIPTKIFVRKKADQ